MQSTTMNEFATPMMYDTEIEETVAVLRNGGLILFPTDTIWGIGCDACNPEAIQKIYDLKQRDASKPFVLLVSSLDMLKNYVRHVHPRIETLLVHHVRPLTVVYDKGRNLPSISIAADGSVAIRVSTDPFCTAIIEAFGYPVVATSANISNEPFPKNFQEISSAVKKGVNLIVKPRRKMEEDPEPSVIVKLSRRGELVFLRD